MFFEISRLSKEAIGKNPVKKLMFNPSVLQSN
jgi:hypothetical protein